MTPIQHRDVYKVTVNNSTFTYADKDAAGAKVMELLRETSVDPLAEFSGSIQWYIDQEPASAFDRLVEEYSEHLHDMDGAAAADRNKPFLLVEENVRGGYWLSSGESVEGLYDYHANQEYSNEWEIVGIFDVSTGEPVRFEVQTTVTVKP